MYDGHEGRTSIKPNRRRILLVDSLPFGRFCKLGAHGGLSLRELYLISWTKPWWGDIFPHNYLPLLMYRMII